jgi:hypothetical protein
MPTELWWRNFTKMATWQKNRKERKWSRCVGKLVSRLRSQLKFCCKQRDKFNLFYPKNSSHDITVLTLCQKCLYNTLNSVRSWRARNPQKQKQIRLCPYQTERMKITPLFRRNSQIMRWRYRLSRRWQTLWPNQQILTSEHRLWAMEFCVLQNLCK